MDHEHILAILAAILLCRENGTYDVPVAIDEAADLLAGAREHLARVNAAPPEILPGATNISTSLKLRRLLEDTTRQWADMIVRRNMSAGPHEEDFIKTMRAVNTVRHEAGLALFEKETDVIGKAQW